eukprot:2063983-Karenia_brevis.AAC.1
MGSSNLIEHIAELFTRVMSGHGDLPTSWAESYITVLFKKGDPKMPGNYRPITLLPILYKLFSRILRGRIG